MINFLLLKFIFLLLSASAHSAIYFVSETGDDNSNGTSESTPWKSITKVNSMMASIVAGDQVLFKKGDTFYGSILISNSGGAGNEIVIGSYGSGPLPVITGKKLITEWTQYSGNIYRANFSDSITHIYINNKLMTIARYPNQGFLKLDANIGNTGIYDAEINQPSGFWVGANCRLRTVNWTYESKVISNSSGGNIIFSSPTHFTTKVNYGYFIDNKLNLLDVQNEWYQDKTNWYVYLYAPGGVDPNTLNIEGSILRHGVSVNVSKHFIKVQDINFNGFAENGVYAYTSNNISVTGCTITQTTANAIRINGSNVTIADNNMEDNINNAIYCISTNGIIANNTIRRTGLYPGYGINVRGYLAMNLHISTRLTIENNIIDSTGYSALSVGKRVTIKNNFIDHSLLVLNDGAGIDIAESDSMLISDNVILNTIGSTESSGNPALYGNGIYVNGGVMKNSTIQNNTCAFNTNSGIYFDHKNTPENNILTGNLLYNNFKTQVIFGDYSATVFIPTYNTIFKKNILYGLSSEQYGLELRGHTDAGISDYGDFDSNYYCNPYSDFLVSRSRYLAPYSTTNYTLEDWQINFNKDINTKSIPHKFDQFGITDTIGGNLITNSKFDSTVAPWVGWPSGSTITWQDNPLLDGGSLRMSWNGIGNSIGLATTNRFGISNGDYYLASLSTAGNHNGTFSLWGFASFSSTVFLFPQTYFSYANERKEHSLIFKSNFDDPLAKMSVVLSLPDSLVYLDNINLFKVNIDRIDSSEKSKIFINQNSFAQNFSLNGINYQDIDGNPVSGNIILQPFSSKILINENYNPFRKLQLKAYIEGLYDSTSGNMKTDTIMVYLRNAASPFNLIDSCKANLDSTGIGSFNFQKALNNVNYYIVIDHKNSLETWSKEPVYFNSNQLSYDFTTARNKAYGYNLKNVGSVSCIYSGDIIKDGEIGLFDVTQITNSAGNFTSGNFPEDLNGDGHIDLKDIGYAFNNALFFVTLKRP